jgi:hypothetical protein
MAKWGTQTASYCPKSSQISSKLPNCLFRNRPGAFSASRLNILSRPRKAGIERDKVPRQPNRSQNITFTFGDCDRFRASLKDESARRVNCQSGLVWAKSATESSRNMARPAPFTNGSAAIIILRLSKLLGMLLLTFVLTDFIQHRLIAK